MKDLQMHPREAILLWCREAAPNPWYPAVFCQTSGTAREQLDPVLDELRLGSLIRLTDWVQGKGQGYTLTEQGAEVVRSPRLLEKLAARGVAPIKVPALQGPAAADSRPSAWDRGEAVRAALLNPPRPVVTLTLLFINIVVFIYTCVLVQQNGAPINKFVGMGFGGRQDPQWAGQIHNALHQSGAIEYKDIYPNHEWWRLLTCCFVHIGMLHLFVNMLTLYLIGPMLEGMWGSVRFLILYLIAGVGGSAAVVMMRDPQTAGASGAIWGILASMAAWIFLNRSAFPPMFVSRWLRRVIFIILLNVGFTFLPGISKAAHFGGGLVGLAVAVPLNYYAFTRGWRRFLALAGVVAVPLVSIGLMDLAFREDQEIKDLKEQLLPALRPLEKAAEDFARGPLLLCRQLPPRKHLEMAEGKFALKEAQKKLQEATKMVNDAGPFHSHIAEEARQIKLELYNAMFKKYQLAWAILDKDAVWDEDDPGWQEQVTRILNAEGRLRKVTGQGD
jgi:membrane associated rhomboid family serine protease